MVFVPRGAAMLAIIGVAALSWTCAVCAAAEPSSALLSGYGAADGYHLSVGQVAVRGGRADAVRWRDVAVLDPGGIDSRLWTGNQCLTADGRYAVVVVLPVAEVDSPEKLASGAYAYSIDLASGQVRLLATHVRLGYDTPGCGTGDSVVLTAFDGSDERSTAIAIADLAAGDVVTRWVPGELTSPVPISGGVIAARGSQLVRISEVPSKAARVVAVRRVGGIPYDLRPLGNGAVDYLVTTPGAAVADVWQLRSGRNNELGFGPRVGRACYRLGHAPWSSARGASSVRRTWFELTCRRPGNQIRHRQVVASSSHHLAATKPQCRGELFCPPAVPSVPLG